MASLLGRHMRVKNHRLFEKTTYSMASMTSLLAYTAAVSTSHKRVLSIQTVERTAVRPQHDVNGKSAGHRA